MIDANEGAGFPEGHPFGCQKDCALCRGEEMHARARSLILIDGMLGSAARDTPASRRLVMFAAFDLVRLTLVEFPDRNAALNTALRFALRHAVIVYTRLTNGLVPPLGEMQLDGSETGDIAVFLALQEQLRNTPELKGTGPSPLKRCIRDRDGEVRDEGSG